LNPNFSTNTVYASHKDSVFHALEVSLTKRLTKGLQFQSNYTWAKSIDNAQASISDCTASSGMASNPYNYRFDRSMSCFSTPHTWVSNVLYNLPSPQGHGMFAAVASGWRVTGIFTAHTGFPFNVWETVERARTGVFGGSANPPVDRPNWNPSFSGPVILGGPAQYYNPNAFVLQPAGTLGNVGRDSLLGPGFAQLDFAVQKDTRLRRLGESGRLEFRAEFFNLFNHPNFAAPNGAVFSGTVTNTVEAPLSTAGQILSTVQPSRQIEFALKVIF
jgi:hypothetical protein